jgi:hypothetical protein
MIEVKIKQGNEMLDATIEMVEGVMVVSPKEVKFEPKDGDVVTVTTETGGNYTCFFKGCVNGDVYSYGGLNNLYNMLFEIGLVCCNKKLKTIYPAPEEEKKKLFDKLAEEGLEWDAEKKEVVKIKWKPKVGDTYFRPDFNRCMFMCYEGKYRYDTMRYIKECVEKGWCFKTEKDCQELVDKLNQAIEGVKP